MLSNCCAVILAAGAGKRLKSKKPKALAEVLFKPMVQWVVDAVRSCEIEDICIVTGHGAEYIEDYFGDTVKYARQTEQLGTGHAVMAASDFIKKHSGSDVLIMYGDAPFISKDTIEGMYNAHKEAGCTCTLLSAVLDNPFGYGRIFKNNGKFEKIVEERDCTAEQKLIKEANVGMYWADADRLLFGLSKITPNNAQHEYYLTDLPMVLAQNGDNVDSYPIGDNDETASANDRVQLHQLNKSAAKREIMRVLNNGVSVMDESGIIISPDANIGRDTLILPGTVIKGKVTIGEDCVIGPNAYIEDSVVGNGVKVNSSQIYCAKVGDGTRIGPFAYIRPDSVIGENVKIGDFVEIKNSTIGARTSVSHLTYIGDSDVGEHVNFGCGTVTCNYDGLKKHRTVIGNDAFIGCNTNLVAPVTVGDGAYTAAGTTVTDDVPEGSLAIGRSRQTNKAGWAEGKIKK